MTMGGMVRSRATVDSLVDVLAIDSKLDGGALLRARLESTLLAQCFKGMVQTTGHGVARG